MPEWTIRMCLLTGLVGMGGPEAALGDDDLLLPTNQNRSVLIYLAGGDCETGESYESSKTARAEGFDPFDATIGEGQHMASQQSSIFGTAMSATGIAIAESSGPQGTWSTAHASSSFRVTFTVERTVIVTIDAEVSSVGNCSLAQVYLTGAPFSIFTECRGDRV